jgi:hypothetical protein
MNCIIDKGRKEGSLFMEKRSVLENHTAGISIIAFVVAVGISLGYYQFIYVPQLNQKPVLPPQVILSPVHLIRFNI